MKAISDAVIRLVKHGLSTKSARNSTEVFDLCRSEFKEHGYSNARAVGRLMERMVKRALIIEVTDVDEFNGRRLERPVFKLPFGDQEAIPQIDSLIIEILNRRFYWMSTDRVYDESPAAFDKLLGERSTKARKEKLRSILIHLSDQKKIAPAADNKKFPLASVLFGCLDLQKMTAAKVNPPKSAKQKTTTATPSNQLDGMVIKAEKRAQLLCFLGKLEGSWMPTAAIAAMHYLSAQEVKELLEPHVTARTVEYDDFANWYRMAPKPVNPQGSLTAKVMGNKVVIQSGKRRIIVVVDPLAITVQEEQK